MKFAIAATAVFLLTASQAAGVAPQLDENDWIIMMDREFCDGNKWNDRGNDQRDAMQMLLRHNERQTDLVFTGPSFTKSVVARLKGHQAKLGLVGTDYKAELRSGWFAICRQSFHDVDPDKGCIVPHVLMTTHNALSIVEFVHRVAPDVDGIMVHCKAGISRSAAVAKWIAEKYELPLEHRYESYNRHVYRLLKEANEIWVRSNK